jgi:hypothetical protein
VSEIAERYRTRADNFERKIAFIGRDPNWSA